MELAIIQIGNSKGLRLKKSILDKYNIKDKVEIVLEEDQIVIRSVDRPRKNWEEAFKQLHELNDDQLLMDDVFKEEDFDEWK